jgi:Putative abortive phage resistance protein AbiGi, antitoxin
MAIDYAIHSDFLVHWTGKDLDCHYSPDWKDSGKSKITRESPLCQHYVDRLHNILKYGLWLTEENETIFLPKAPGITNHKKIPKTPMLCFTELKLSESRTHAKRYGRLGIGVKRKYLFDRYGRPLAYFGFNEQSNKDTFLNACANDLIDKTLLNFFKPMNSDITILNYDLYSESEWRILFFQELLQEGLLIDPRDAKNIPEHAYFNSLTAIEQHKLKYLAPLDGWFALIIYPSLEVKNRAQKEDSRIKSEIMRIKSNQLDHGNQVEGGSWPMEIDLDACRHF